MSEELRKIAREMLESGKADVVIGYGSATLPNRTTPVFITAPDAADKLIAGEFCHNNLSVYLTSKSLKQFGKKAIVAKPCDIRSIVGLLQENQIARESVVIIGLRCGGVKDAETGESLEKCRTCSRHTPEFRDALVGDAASDAAVDEFAEVAEFEKKSADERWDFWSKHFSRCIRCYACRQVCPMCYCERCAALKSMPQWIDSGAHPHGNMSFHIFRALHSAGRCIGCGECERVCPANIPLTLLNRKLQKEIKDHYGYEAGQSPEAKPPMCSFDTGDKEDFIR